MEFLYLLCNLYIIGLTVALPLYTGGTYWQIGDSKYMLFRNLSLLCLGLWIAASLAEAIRRRRGHGYLEVSVSGKRTEEASGWCRFSRRRLSTVDIFMLLYGAVVLLSAFFSKYGNTAWMGYREWYMGAVSQLIFVGIYFLVSRCYDGKRYSLALGIAAFFLVTVLGILHRLGLDIPGVLEEFRTGDWEYSHMLSTIGNINWFCGYCSVTLALPVVGYLKAKDRWKQVTLYIVSVLGLFLLFVQGSDIGVLMTVVCLGVCLLWGIKNGDVFDRTLLLAAGLCVLIPAYGFFGKLRGEKVLAALPADSIGWNVINLKVWWFAGILCVIARCILYRLSKKDRETLQRNVRRGILLGFFSALVAGAGIHLGKQPVDEAWGSGRGTLWRVAWHGFLQNGWLQKLIGVGPDCFAEYIYSAFTGDELLILEGRWSNAIYANAHNEWLNHLINLGIMGTGCYLGIFTSGAWRYRRCKAGILALCMYGTASLTCFQQCMSTPLLFMVLGICEASLSLQEQNSLQHGTAGSEECEIVSVQDDIAAENLQTTERQGYSYEMGEV